MFDPAGEKKTIPYADFLKEWTGYVLFFTPNEHFTVQKETIGLFARFLPLFRPYIGVVIEVLTAHGNQFLPRRVNKSYGFIRARNIMLFKGSFDPVSRLYIRMRLSAVLRSMFKFCCIFLLWILHLSSSKSTSKSQCIDSTDHSVLAW